MWRDPGGEGAHLLPDPKRRGENPAGAAAASLLLPLVPAAHVPEDAERDGTRGGGEPPAIAQRLHGGVRRSYLTDRKRIGLRFTY